MDVTLIQNHVKVLVIAGKHATKTYPPPPPPLRLHVWFVMSEDKALNLM